MTPGPEFEHGEWDALAVGWAMTALDPDDEAIFLPHLAVCARCADTVAETTRTVGDLAWIVPMETPPSELRGRLMTAVLNEPRTATRLDPPRTDWPAGPPATGTGGPAGGPYERGPTAPPPTQQPRPVPPRTDAPPPDLATRRPGSGGRHAAPGADNVVPLRRRAWKPISIAAALLVVVAGLGAWNVQLRNDQNQLRDQIGALSQPPRVVELASPTGRPVATMLVRGDTIDVVTKTVAPTSGAASYWVWGMTGADDKNPVPIAGFRVGSSQLSGRTVGSGGLNLAGMSYFALSLEQSAGTPTVPTQPLIGQPGPAR